MKILYIHQYFKTPQIPGSTRSYEFAKRLVDRGDTVYMITSNWQEKSNTSYSLIEGIHVHWAPISYNNKMSYFKRLFIFFGFIWYVFLLGRKLDYDLIIASSTPLTVAIPSILLKRLKGVKMIIEIRDLWPQLPIAIGAIKSKIFISIAMFLEKITYKNSDHIICLSPGMKKEISLITSNDKITIITNLSDISGFQKLEKRIELKIPVSEKNPLILYTGSFGRINGLLYLVEIAQAMQKINPKIYFLLAGNGYDKVKIINRSKKYGLYNNTLFCIDYVSKDQMPSLLSKATITSSFFIDIPAMENNSANKFFDGLAAGKPVMINYGGWQSDLLKNFGCGFTIPSDDAISSAKIINKMIIDKTNLNRMSKSSVVVAKKFDLETNCKKFLSLVDTVLYS